MIFKLSLFTAWLVCSVLVTVVAFFLGRFIARKIEDFIDHRH